MKKFLSLLLVLLLCLGTVTCFASPANSNGHANGHNGVGPNALAKAEKIVAKANSKIAKYVAKAQATAEDDVAWLVSVTNAVAAKAKADVAALGLTAVCTYVIYTVDGQQVAIDPLHVVNDPSKPRPPISTQVGDN